MSGSQGWGSSASLPLRCHDQVVGALNLYAPNPEAFSKDVKSLLLDMVVNVDLALGRFYHQEQQQRVQLELEKSEYNYRQLTETIHDVIWRLDSQTLTICYVSPAVRSVLGYQVQELQGQPFQITLCSDSPGWLRDIKTLASQQQHSPGDSLPYRTDELQQRHRDGSSIWSEITTTLAPNSITGAMEYYCVSRDITARKIAESRLEYLAYYDPLTELPNRTLLCNLIDQTLRTARRSDQPVALLALGLDRFKVINDAIGYDTGNAVLVQIARRLHQHLRDNDIIGRIGSDEFVLTLPGSNAAQVAQLCERLQEIVRKPINHNQQTITLTTSIGVAMFPADGNDRDTLMRKKLYVKK